MADTIFQRYRKKAEKANIPANTKQSLDWFRVVARKTRARFDAVRKGGTEGRLTPGAMVVFQYDPKHKVKLPYYDRFPLIIYCEPFRGGFYGFNLHYLSPALRAKVLSAVQGKSSKIATSLTNVPVVKHAARKYVNRQLITSLTKVPVMKHAIKKYLNNHLTSRPVIIDKDDWEIAISLPFEGFEKASNKEVWRDANRGRKI